MKKNIIKTFSVLFILLLFNVTGAKAQEKKDSLVNVAFGKVAKNDLLGAVSTVNVSELMKKNYSTYSLDGLQSYIGGYNGTIWGQSALVMVDGIPRNASDVRSSEIESITVLKGVSAIALYGSKAAKGVILITTKRGQAKPLTVDVRANTTLYIPKGYPSYLNASNYMTLYNEALSNDGGAAKYTQTDIDNTAAGTNPYRYADINFFGSDYLKKAYNKTDATVEVSGGNEHARYYTNFGLSSNNSIMNFGNSKKNNDLQFNLRANVDMNLNSWLSASTKAVAVFSDNYTSRGDFWGASSTMRPNWIASTASGVSPLIPVSMIDQSNATLQTMVNNSPHLIDGKYLLGGTSTDLTNPFSDMLVAGYIKNKSRTFMFDVNLAADLKAITQGLSFKTAYSVDYTDFYTEGFNQPYAVYTPVWSTVNGADMITNLTKLNTDGNTTNETIGETRYTQTMSMSAQFNYKRTFDTYHNVSATLLGWGYQTQTSRDVDHSSSDYHRLSNLNLGLQIGYNYQHKYYFDFTSAMVHSAKLPEGLREKFSPTATLGWRISDEDFFKDKVSFVDNLKLTSSFGILNQDIDISNYYLYKGYFNRDGWYQWRDGTAGGSQVLSVRGDNPFLTFVERKEFRVGLETSLFHNLIDLDANYFSQTTNGLLTTGAATLYPSSFGAFLPNLNFNKDKRTGADFTVTLNKKIGEFDVSLGLAGMYYTSKAVIRDEITYTGKDAYRMSAGLPLDASRGYICEGIFKDQNDVSSHVPQSWGAVKPGDLKYKDVNEDGVVDTKDQVNLGHNGWSGSPISYGVNLTLKWRNFSLFAMGTGQSGAVAFKNSAYYWVYGSRKYSDVVLGRAILSADKSSVTNIETATYPRLSATDGVNNYQNSSFWLYKTTRFDLSRVQLTYDFNNDIFKNSFIHGLSLYLSGQDLLTISKERKLMETNIGSAPQNRSFILGLKASF
jgi:TonB-linked SusC/RagA family outer membrane protein